MTRHHSCRVSPFGHPRINARLAAPRGISQPPTSFIGSQCQGIHHAPLNTYNTKTKNEFQKKLHINTQNQPHPQRVRPTILRARCSQPLSTNQTPHPTTKAEQQHADTRNRMPPPEKGHGPVVSKPNSVSGSHRSLLCTKPAPLQRTDSSRLHPHQLGVFFVVLLRKEVIQPHLPVRLPCYDFVPIADPTFDGSLHKG